MQTRCRPDANTVSSPSVGTNTRSEKKKLLVATRGAKTKQGVLPLSKVYAVSPKIDWRRCPHTCLQTSEGLLCASRHTGGFSNFYKPNPRRLPAHGTTVALTRRSTCVALVVLADLSCKNHCGRKEHHNASRVSMIARDRSNAWVVVSDRIHFLLAC